MNVTESFMFVIKAILYRVDGIARRKKSNDAVKAIAQVGVRIFFFSPPPFQKSQWMLEKCLLIILIEATLIFNHRNPLFTFPKCSALSAAS